jgi:hypothetical protein
MTTLFELKYFILNLVIKILILKSKEKTIKKTQSNLGS